MNSWMLEYKKSSKKKWMLEQYKYQEDELIKYEKPNLQKRKKL